MVFTLVVAEEVEINVVQPLLEEQELEALVVEVMEEQVQVEHVVHAQLILVVEVVEVLIDHKEMEELEVQEL